MAFKLRQAQIQTQPTRRGRGKARVKHKHKNCRSCGSKNLVSAGPDQFCCDCDWHTCFEYVGKGYMNNLHFAYAEHFPKPKKPKPTIVELPKGPAPVQPETPKPTLIPTQTTEKETA